MDRIYTVVIVLCALFIITSPVVASETKELTLEQAVGLALEKNPDIQTLSLEEDSATAQKDKEITGQRIEGKHYVSSDYNKNFLSQV